MAGSATDILVRAIESKFGLGMVERLDGAPFLVAMAIVAAFAKGPFVTIFCLVTINAPAWG